MKLLDLIGKQVIRTKPSKLPSSGRFWNFSFMTSSIEIVDVGQNNVFYKNVYPKDSWMRIDPLMMDMFCWKEKMERYIK